MIKQAIIPLAGQGTRLLPLTSVFAKELLPINGKPGIEYILDECIDAGIKEIIFIISKKKEIIKKYFFIISFFFEIIKIISFTPASTHSSKIYSIPGLPFIGSSSLGKTLVKGSKRVPKPARGIIACLIIKMFYL